LLGREASELDADRLGAAARAREAIGDRAIVVFKGPGTVIAGPDGDGGRATYVNVPGGPMLSQGGTGDALTGIIASLAAQQAVGGGAVTAALVAAAVWIHGRAAERIAERVAPHPANASALIEEIGPVLHEVLG
jgi:NAD(P)H-hydrate epimerase